MLTEGLAGCRSATAQGREHYAHQSGTEGVCMSNRSAMHVYEDGGQEEGVGGGEASCKNMMYPLARSSVCLGRESPI